MFYFQGFAPKSWKSLETVPSCYLELAYKSSIRLQGIGGKTAQVTVNGDIVANSRAVEALEDSNLSLD